MESDRHFELYLEHFRRWGTPDEIGKVLRWATPAEIAAIMKRAGSPDDLMELLTALQARQEAWEWSRRFWGRAKDAALAAGLVGGVLGAIIAGLVLVERLRGLWPE